MLCYFSEKQIIRSTIQPSFKLSVKAGDSPVCGKALYLVEMTIMISSTHATFEKHNRKVFQTMAKNNFQIHFSDIYHAFI